MTPAGQGQAGSITLISPWCLPGATSGWDSPCLAVAERQPWLCPSLLLGAHLQAPPPRHPQRPHQAAGEKAGVRPRMFPGAAPALGETSPALQPWAGVCRRGPSLSGRLAETTLALGGQPTSACTGPPH